MFRPVSARPHDNKRSRWLSTPVPTHWFISRASATSSAARRCPVRCPLARIRRRSIRWVCMPSSSRAPLLRSCAAKPDVPGCIGSSHRQPIRVISAWIGRSPVRSRGRSTPIGCVGMPSTSRRHRPISSTVSSPRQHLGGGAGRGCQRLPVHRQHLYAASVL